MAKTIKCSNPFCDELIIIPVGATQVICPKCNTWYFPDPDELGGSFVPGQNVDNVYDKPPEKVRHEPDYNYTPDPPLSNGQNEGSSEQSPGAEDSSNQKNEIAPNDLKMAYLLTTTGVRMPLKEGRNVIGRKNADLILEDRTVSRRHCVIEVSKNEKGYWEYVLFDIGHIEGTASTNGVFITGRTQRFANYERLRIAHGTSIRIGTVLLTLQNN